MHKIGAMLAKVVLLGALGIFVLSLLGNVLLSLGGFYINVSSSLPYGLYKVEYRQGISHSLFGLEGIVDDTLSSLFVLKNSNEHGVVLSSQIVEFNLRPERGQLVLACLNSKLSSFAYERNYIGAGKCPGGYAPVGKRAMALEGDIVEITSQGVSVNGVVIRNSKLAIRDSLGRPLPSYGEVGSSYVLDKDEVLLINERANSFDGRYFGPLKSYALIAKLKPYWIWQLTTKKA